MVSQIHPFGIFSLHARYSHSFWSNSKRYTGNPLAIWCQEDSGFGLFINSNKAQKINHGTKSLKLFHEQVQVSRVYSCTISILHKSPKQCLLLQASTSWSHSHCPGEQTVSGNVTVPKFRSKCSRQSHQFFLFY